MRAYLWTMLALSVITIFGNAVDASKGKRIVVEIAGGPASVIAMLIAIGIVLWECWLLFR